MVSPPAPRNRPGDAVQTIARMSVGQLNRAIASLSSGASSLTPGLRLLAKVVQGSDSEAQATESVARVFAKLTPGERAAFLQAARIELDRTVEPPSKLGRHLSTLEVTKTRLEPPKSQLRNLDVQAVEDAMTEVWVLIAETRYLFGCPADSWRAPHPMQYLDPFPREHERWGKDYPERRKLAILVDGTPCDVVTAGLRRMDHAGQLLDGVRKMTTSDRVPLRDEFFNVAGGIGGIKPPNRIEGTIATTTRVVEMERRRLETLVQQGAELFDSAQKEYQIQRTKRISFFRDFRGARQMAKCAVERGIWEAKPLLKWMP